MADKAIISRIRQILMFVSLFLLSYLTLSTTFFQARIAAPNIFAESGESNVFLPVITYTPSKGIYGHVTFGNLGSWPDVPLDLRFYNGSEWSTIASTTTDNDGNYSFKDIPGLLAGQRYYVRFLNTEAPGYLFTWRTLPITNYTTGQEVHAGDFSIAGIGLFSPYAGQQTSLPVDFRWGLRPGYTTDSYELNLFEPQTGTPYFYTDPSLGFVENYTLHNLPPGFEYGPWYVWNVWVYGPNGSAEGDWGISYWSYYVRFFAISHSELVLERRIQTSDILHLLANQTGIPIDLDLDR
jgi:hypothetical protein